MLPILTLMPDADAAGISTVDTYSAAEAVARRDACAAMEDKNKNIATIANYKKWLLGYYPAGGIQDEDYILDDDGRKLWA